MKLNSADNIQEEFQRPLLGTTIHNAWESCMTEVRYILVSQVMFIPTVCVDIMNPIDPYE